MKSVGFSLQEHFVVILILEFEYKRMFRFVCNGVCGMLLLLLTGFVTVRNGLVIRAIGFVLLRFRFITLRRFMADGATIVTAQLFV